MRRATLVVALGTIACSSDRMGTGPIATRLVFSVQPVSTTAGVLIAPAVQVTALDDGGAVATSFSGAITISLATNPGSATLSGTPTRAAAVGVATFSDLRLNRTGSGYTLRATSGALSASTSVTFAITPGPPQQLQFLVQPTDVVAGASFAPAVQVVALDSLGNLALRFAGPVTVSLTTNGSGAVLGGPTTLTATLGIATFTALHVDKSGSGYTMQAASGALTTAASAPFMVSPGAPSRLAFTVQPSAATAGTAFTPPVQVTAQDAFGNTATAFAGPVALSLGANPGGGALSGTNPATAASGVAVFGDLSLTKIGGGYTLVAAATGLASDTSDAFTVGPGAASASQSSVLASPTTLTASGGSSAAAITVTAKDTFGNPIQGASVTLSSTGSGNTLTQPAPTDVNGVATGHLSSTAAERKIVSATIGVVAVARTDTVTVTAAAAMSLAFTVEPTTTAATTPIAPAVQVTARDAFGNRATGFAGNVTIAIGANPSGGTLSGTSTLEADTGVASFPGLKIDKAGAGYTLVATSGTLMAGTSQTFSITVGAPTRLAFTVQPSGTQAGSPITPAIQVAVQDAGGNLVTSATNSISMAIAANSGGAVLSGTTPVSAVNGIAQFSNLSLTKSGTAYTLVATALGLTADTSLAFDITSGSVSAGASTVVAAPAALTASNGTSSATITVTAKDGLGNPVQGVTVVLAATGTGNTLTQPTGPTDAAGVATGHLSSTGAGPKIVSATIAGTAIAQTATVTVGAAAVSANQATVGAAPSSITACNTGCSAGAGTASLITVTAKDAFGNLIAGASVALGVSGGGNTLAPAGLTQTTDGSGQATWTLNSTIAEAKTISATIDGVGITQTASVTVARTGVSASQSTVVAAPGSITACNASCSAGGGTASLITVTAKDTFGNTIPSASVVLGVSGGGNTLAPASLTQTTSGTGQATWTLSSTIAESKTISVTIEGVAITQTATVTVAPSSVSASQTTVTAAPSSITACNTGCSPGGGTASLITVTAKDQFGNAISGAAVVLAATGSGNTVTQPGATGSTGATTGVLASTISGLKTVTASVTGVAIAQAPVVTVVAGPVSAAQSMVKVSQDTIEASGGGVTTSITVTASDALGNPISGAAVTVSATGTGVMLTGPTGVTDGTGVYSQATLSATAIGAKIVSATIGGVAVTQTATVTVEAGEVSTSQSTIVSTPTTITASSGSGGATITITARDDQGNPIAGVNVVLSATGAGNTLIQPAGATNASGVATGTLRSTTAGSKYISATIGGTGLSQLDTVTVTPAAASTVAFTVQPTSATVATAISPPIQVQVRDQFGNPVTASTAKIALTFGANPGGGTLTGGDSVVPVNGVATFASVSISAVGTGYTLVAGAGGVTGQATSDPFNIISGAVSAATSLVSAAPGTITASSGSSLSTITVTARDAGSNPVSGATVALMVTGSGNILTPPGLLTTNSSGVATATLSATAAGVKTISAVVNGVAVTQQASVTVVPAAISGSQSTLLASPGAIVQVTGVSTITVTAADAFGNPVTGAAVSLSATGSGNTLTQPGSLTDANGIATGTLSSSVAGNKVVTATAGGVALTHSDTVAVTAQGSSVVLVGAGDIAVCGKADDDSTASLVTGVLNATPGAQVITLGDNAYPDGTTSDFSNCYDPTWGAFKAKTHPSAGNHDYNTPGATPYFAYFGAAAGDPAQGYYSYDIGAWHVIVLNSEIATSAGSPQVQWLQADLAAHPNVCTLAYWHEPLYSSVGGTTGTTGATISSVRPFWDALYAAGADVVLNGHRHVYERLARMAPDGSPDPANGIREIIVGTGGDSGGDLTNIFPTSEVRNGRTYGVIKLTLLQSSYSWQFLPAEGATFTDSGTESCH